MELHGGADGQRREDQENHQLGELEGRFGLSGRRRFESGTFSKSCTTSTKRSDRAQARMGRHEFVNGEQESGHASSHGCRQKHFRPAIVPFRCQQLVTTTKPEPIPIKLRTT